ncbi:MAG: TIGR03862 family flavoprotein [Parvibaculaceae bacterium]
MTVRAAIIGGGPSGLMAAEALTKRGVRVDLFDAMPSLGRKFLMAGKSGLNLTHSEPLDLFLSRYGAARPRLEDAIRAFPPEALRQWAADLGTETFVGSSGRVFPKSMKAAPLLRAWLKRLRTGGVQVHVRHKWAGWSDEGTLLFETPQGTVEVRANVTIFALGGASWPALGSDAAWVPHFEKAGIALAPFQPANCGFNVAWSDHLRDRFAGAPVKAVALTAGGHREQGEFVVTETGIEGSGIYTHAQTLREEIKRDGEAVLHVDLMPDVGLEKVEARLAKPRGSRSLATHLKKTVFLSGVKASLLRECAPDSLDDPHKLAAAIKDLPVRLISPRPIGEAISSAGGVHMDELDDGFMLKRQPGLFCTGEMLDWEAPTGGYLLTACMATGLKAGETAADFLAMRAT